ncbi:MAG: hypothetical protein N2171_03560 [Clostridia bacterium]|nr:hypothetical protein [Clostridia bacterium]
MKYLCASTTAYVASLLSKTTTCSLPVALLITVWWKRGRIERKDLYHVLPMFVVGIPLGLSTALFERFCLNATGPGFDFTFFERLLIASRAWWFYIGKLLWPSELIFCYPRWVINQHSMAQWLFFFGALLFCIILWLLQRKIGRGPFAAIFFFSVTIFPALGFFNTLPMRYSFVADHFQYLASVGIIVICSAGIFSVVLRLLGKRMIMCVSLLVLIVLGVQTYKQSHVYKDFETLFRDTRSKNPAAYGKMFRGPLWPK